MEIDAVRTACGEFNKAATISSDKQSISLEGPFSYLQHIMQTKVTSSSFRKKSSRVYILFTKTISKKYLENLGHWGRWIECLYAVITSEILAYKGENDVNTSRTKITFLVQVNFGVRKKTTTKKVSTFLTQAFLYEQGTEDL